MRTQFIKELNRVLKDYNITGFKILQHWLLKKCNLMAEENYCHFYGFDDSKKLYLNIRGLSESGLMQLNAFLAEESKITFHKLVLSETLLFNRLLPEFRQDLENGFFSAKELSKYQYISRKFIQNKLVNTIAKECRALNELLPPITQQLTTVIKNCYEYSRGDLKGLAT